MTNSGANLAGARASGLAGIINTVGAPLLRFLQGRARCCRLRGFLGSTLMRRDPGTRSFPIPHSLARDRLRRANNADNCAIAIAPATLPIHSGIPPFKERRVGHPRWWRGRALMGEFAWRGELPEASGVRLGVQGSFAVVVLCALGAKNNPHSG